MTDNRDAFKAAAYREMAIQYMDAVVNLRVELSVQSNEPQPAQPATLEEPEATTSGDVDG